MKNFRYDLYKMGVADVKAAPHDAMEVLLSSKEFCKDWDKHVRDLAGFKTKKNKVKSFRNTTYSAIGCLDKNDLLQEARLAFLKAYDNVNWDKLEEIVEPERQAVLWGFLKGSTILNLENQIREVKDGIKVPKREMFLNSDSPDKKGAAISNHLTQLFDKMEVVFSEKVQDGHIPNYQNELLGYFLDEVIEAEIPKHIGKDVLRCLFGLDDELKTYSELGEFYKVGQSTIRTVKQRALDRLKKPLVKTVIARFLDEYRIRVNGLDLEGYEIN